MKKVIFAMLSILILVSCKNEEKKTEEKQTERKAIASGSDLLRVFKGEFIYTDEAAVLMGKDFIYGVTINDKAKELGEKVAPIKTDENDMVPVIVTGKLFDKADGEETWDKFLTIVDIVQVSEKPSKADVKIEGKKMTTAAQSKISKSKKVEEK